MKRIVLIDDDPTTNYLNKLIIQKSALVDEVVSFDSPQEALIFFKASHSEGDQALVLLDINMPVMNGWQFLEQYEALKRESSNKMVVLTSSINPADKQLADEKESILDYLPKPLSVENIKNLVSTYLS